MAMLLPKLVSRFVLLVNAAVSLTQTFAYATHCPILGEFHSNISDLNISHIKAIALTIQNHST